MRYLANSWYQAGWSSEIDEGGRLVRTLLDIPILIFRKADGSLSALHDRCPHRFAPLSAGSVEQDTVRCGYHGLAFASDGTCAQNPHGPITSAMLVRSFPTIERHQAIWLWFGHTEQADPAKIPNLTFIDDTPEPARIFSYMPTGANYQLLTDNIMDLSHADYLHPNTLGGMMVGAKTKTFVEGDAVVAEWRSLDCTPPPAFRGLVPVGNADIWTEVRWTAPAVMVLGTGATPTGIERTPVDEAYTLHNMVPETATTSHYFICSTRRFLTHDEQFSSLLKQTLTQAFNFEDKPMLEKQQARMQTDDLWSLKPVLLPIDAGAVRARRKLEELIERERYIDLSGAEA